MAPSLKLIELMLPRAQKQALVSGCHAVILTLYVFGATTFDFWQDITICFIKKKNHGISHLELMLRPNPNRDPKHLGRPLPPGWV